MNNNQSYMPSVPSFGNKGGGTGFDWRTGLGGAGEMLGGFLGMNQKSPADAAMPYLNAIPGQIQPNYQPYMGAGTNALNQLQPQYQSLLSDPAAMMQHFGSSFQQSPGYGWQRDQALAGATNAAAAGGMAGSPMHQQQAGTIANQLANQDYYNYLQHVMGLYGQGLSGFSNLAGLGENAATNYSQDLVTNAGNQAKLAYEGQQSKNESQGNGLMGILGGAGSIAGSLFGGPAGGMAGGAAGNYLGHLFG